MIYKQAKAALRRGRFVARKCWEGTFVSPCTFCIGEDLGAWLVHIVDRDLYWLQLSPRPWHPNKEDLDAEDWVIVKPLTRDWPSDDIYTLTGKGREF